MATLVQHLVFLFLLLVAPVWDFYDTSRLKKNPSSNGKIRYYNIEQENHDEGRRLRRVWSKKLRDRSLP
jgi:hypothetical protein